MKEAEYSTVRKIRFLLKQIHIHPAYMLGPIFLSLLTAAFEGIGIGLLVPILTGFLQKNFSFIIDAPYIGRVMHLLPESILANDRILFGILLGGFVGIIITKNIPRINYMIIFRIN